MSILDSPSTEPALTLREPSATLTMRDFGDVAATRKAVYDNVLQAAQTLPPLSNARHTLALSNVSYMDPDQYSPAQRKQAVLSGTSLQRRLRGTWTLTDNATGQVLDTKTSTVAHVPHMTDAGTFVRRGSEYTVTNQLRLRPGIFSRTKSNGEIEAHVNVLPGEGVSHRYFLDPAKGVFYLRLGQAKIPLMPLARALGAQDKDLREAWGDELLQSNYPEDNPRAFNKLIGKLVRRNLATDRGEQQKQLAEAFAQMKLDPDVTEQTLGKRYETLGLEPLLATTKKLIAISRGEQEVDDRDHMAYQRVFGPEDLFAERLLKDYGRLQKQMLFKASFQQSLRSVPVGALDKQLHSVFTHSGLAQGLEEINSGEIFDKLYRVSRLGEGGLPGLDSVPEEARAVQPSHFGFVDPVRTPESLRAGIDVQFARAAKKGSDGRIYSPFTDARTGQQVYRSPQDLLSKIVAFPRAMEQPGDYAAVMQRGRIRYVPKDQVDYVLPHFENAFSPLANLIPMKSAAKGQRVSMGSRMLTQALPLANAEAPLVQSGMPEQPDRSYEEEYGKQLGAVHASKPGVIRSVSEGAIEIVHDDGTTQQVDLDVMMPHARKTYSHQTPLVQPGMRVNAGDILAKSNYTDDKGRVALGLNARVAYTPWRGLNYEDAVVVSESFAKRAASEHAYQHGVDFDETMKSGRSNYLSLFPAKYNRAQLDTIDDRGIVKPGTVVHYDDPLVLAAKERSQAYGRAHKKGAKAWSDASEVWTHHAPGIVTDVHFDEKKGATVLVKSTMPLQEGDKLSGLYGDKGIASAVLPDDQMPQLPDGQPAEIVLNPLGVISRTNPAQVMAAVLGKIAAKTGKPYKIRDFEDIEDLVDFTQKEMLKHNVKDVEHVIDPETGRKIPEVLTGVRYFLKLHHTAESKGQGRSTGGYTAAGEPAKGGETGSKRLALLDTQALLSHGAVHTLQDAHLIRGQRNDDFWLAFMQGHNPPKPKVPLVFQKFVNELKASGINVVPEAGKLNIMALTDKDIATLAGSRKLKNSDTLQVEKDMRPIPGGLFDPQLFGAEGERWASFDLPEPMPNPVMEEPIRRVLGLTQKELEAVVTGTKELPTGTGPGAIHKALTSIDVAKEIAAARMAIASGKRTARDTAIRKLGYLKSCEKLGIHPSEWMVTSVPVLPPKFRPISLMSGSNVPLVPDPNYLYRELFEATQNLRELSGAVDDISNERAAVYKGFKAVAGLADPTHPKLVEKNVKGILRTIFGSSPKSGTVQAKLISTSTDAVGRATVAPDPDLDMDHLGLPENRAWDIYKTFIVRRLRRRGLPVTEAARHVEDRTPLARNELIAEMDARPVIMNRAPVLHRYGILAFKPRLVKGDILRVSPLIVGGFGMDFDGDASQYHVPVSQSSVQEALERMLPSKNLLAASDMKTPMHGMRQEYQGGLYAATALPKPDKRPHRFIDKQSAMAAFRRGDLPLDAVVEIQQ